MNIVCIIFSPEVQSFELQFKRESRDQRKEDFTPGLARDCLSHQLHAQLRCIRYEKQRQPRYRRYANLFA